MRDIETHFLRFEPLRQKREQRWLQEAKTWRDARQRYNSRPAHFTRIY
ncbi:hypothetical protein BM28_A1833 [Brucella melitensis M28]|nr:hypothetical protein BM28_A1833 [Brucella melitensis M28]AEW14426.1 hypothetical protein BCA52141_I2256 [Brucella canis HSK A52141]